MSRTVFPIPRPTEGRLSRGVAKGGTKEGSGGDQPRPSWAWPAVPAKSGAAPCGSAARTAGTRAVPGHRPAATTSGARGASLFGPKGHVSAAREGEGIRPKASSSKRRRRCAERRLCWQQHSDSGLACVSARRPPHFFGSEGQGMKAGPAPQIRGRCRMSARLVCAPCLAPSSATILVR
jgi:hypothetical protein